MPIGKARTFQEIGRDDLLSFAEELNLPRAAANRILTPFRRSLVASGPKPS